MVEAPLFEKQIMMSISVILSRRDFKCIKNILNEVFIDELLMRTYNKFRIFSMHIELMGGGYIMGDKYEKQPLLSTTSSLFKQLLPVLGIIPRVPSLPGLEDVQDEIRDAAMQADKLLSDIHDEFADIRDALNDPQAKEWKRSKPAPNEYDMMNAIWGMPLVGENGIVSIRVFEAMAKVYE